MNLASIGIPITYVHHDMILLLASQVCCFFLPEDSGYVNLKHDSEIENMLRERDIVAEGEFETNRCDVGLQQFFSYVLENEGLSHPPRSWREAKRNF